MRELVGKGDFDALEPFARPKKRPKPRDKHAAS